mmetsp:Transcript_17381/g.22599  ORF Transcript_17381/g.22599 Transcript_17381/m.22599 type:complete len:351 (+) Transcript_17381:64-1116(+)
MFPFWLLNLVTLLIWSLPFVCCFRLPNKPTVSRRVDALFSLGDTCGLTYNEPVFRPPAEWRSLILQVTEGCSWNRCTFCEMYQTKNFRIKSMDVLENELMQIVQAGGAPHVRDVFLADGDAMALPTQRMVQVLQLIHKYLPKVRRISSYCLPRNIRHTSVSDLKELRSNGLSLVYIGCESGNDKVLQGINKGETFESSLSALEKLGDANIKRSVMILLGLGGTNLTLEHAEDSARLVNAAPPEYLSVLTTSFPLGKQRVESGYQQELGVDFQELTPRQSLQELERLLELVDIPVSSGKTIFRSDHASNYLVLKGRLGRDKGRLLDELQAVLNAPESDDIYNLRPEWARGL